MFMLLLEVLKIVPNLAEPETQADSIVSYRFFWNHGKFNLTLARIISIGAFVHYPRLTDVVAAVQSLGTDGTAESVHAPATSGHRTSMQRAFLIG